MNGKKILIIAVSVNLMFLGLYVSFSSISAAEQKQQTQKDVRREAVQQDPRQQLESIRQREELLRIRQRELQELERRIDDKIKRLNALETSVRTEIGMYRQISDQRTKHLVKIYSSMKPNAAATLMNQLETELAAEVFLNMKGDIVGGILSYMDPPKAAAITKRLMSNRGKPAPATAQAE